MSYSLSDLHNNPYIKADLRPITLTMVQLSPVFTKPIGPQNGGTGFKDYTQGDMLVGGSSGAVRKLAVGGPGQILTCASSNVQWSNALTSLKNSLIASDVKNQYTFVSNQMKSLQTQFANEGVSVSEFGQQTGYINGQIAIVSADVNANAAALTTQGTNITTMSAQKDVVNTDVADISTKITNMDNAMNAIDSDLTAQLSAIATTQSTTASLNSSIQAAESSVSNNTMFKNLLTNGDFSVWQRSTYFSDANNPQYVTADHWRHGNFHGGTLTSQKGTATVNGLNVSTLKLSLAGNSGGFYLQNAIEDARALQNQTATVSFWTRCTSVVPFTLSVYQYYGATVTVSQTAQQATSSWTKITQSFFVPTMTSVVDPSYLILSLEMDAGVDFSGLEIALAQFEQGGAATPFGFRPYQVELTMCRRYFENGFASFSGHASANLGVARSFNYLVDKYQTPNIGFQIISATGFQNTATLGFLNQSSGGSVRITKDATNGFGAFVVRFSAESEIL